MSLIKPENIIGITFLVFLNAFLLSAQQLAFPGAEGFGRFTTGGRGGSVYHVTNLNDSGPGSFRDAVSQPDRTVVFDVGGVIHIGERIVIQKNITIAGQTAPGDGITIYGNGIALTSSSGNDIIRYIRIRMGEFGDSGKDAIGISEGQNYMLDHVSVSWGRDGTIDLNGDIGNVTIQNCIISQGLEEHSTGGLIQSTGGVSLLRNLWIDNNTRNPKVKGINEYINNVVYNWNVAAYILGDSDGDSYANVINNYFISGPNTSSLPFTRGNLNFHLYASDNFKDMNNDGILNGIILADNEYDTVDRLTKPHDFPVLNSLDPALALEIITGQAGAFYPARDTVDLRLISELTSYGILGEIIDSENAPPMIGPGKVDSGTAPTDTDQDGMPDAWESLHNLNSMDPEDRNTIGEEGYTMLEIYLNSLGHHPYPATLTVLNNGHSTQSLDKDSLISNFTVAWDNARTVCVNGLPEGVYFQIDTINKTVSFSGTVQESGTFFYTITTFGGSPDAALLDTFRIGGGQPAILVWNGPGDSLQTLNFGDTISSFSYSWDFANSVEITGLPPGVSADIDNDNKSVFISGTPAQPGHFAYKINTTGGDINDSAAGKFIVTGNDSTIIIQENQDGFCSIDGTIDRNNDGYTGDGFSNTSNATGAAIEYQVISDGGSSGLVLRYANGSSDRPASVTINNVIIEENFSMPNTSGWTTWKTIKLNTELSSGKNKIRFAATTKGGLPNIDYLSVITPGAEPGDCIDPVPDTFSLTTSITGLGILIPSEGRYVDKSLATIVAVPETGWKTSRWTGADSTSGDTAYITMIKHSAVSVFFSKIIEGDTILIQENELGFCEIDGTIDNDNSGYTGDGFANTENATDSSIVWAIQVPQDDFYNIIFRYANGTSGDRAGSLFIDDSLYYSKVTLPGTGDWIKWKHTHDYSVGLKKGSHFIKLSAITKNGLSNIDYICVIGLLPDRIGCDSVGTEIPDTVTTVHSENHAGKIKVFPIPAMQGNLSIDLSDLESGNYLITVINTMGQIIYQKPDTGNGIVQIDELKSGTYIIRVTGKHYNANCMAVIP